MSEPAEIFMCLFQSVILERGHQSLKYLDRGSNVTYLVGFRATRSGASLPACRGLGVVVDPACTVVNPRLLLCVLCVSLQPVVSTRHQLEPPQAPPPPLQVQL